MREVASWDFVPPVVSGSTTIVWASLRLDEAQLNILWKVAQEGPNSLYRLSNCTYMLPQKLNCERADNIEAWVANLEKPIEYKRSFVFKKVQQLERKGLVKTEIRKAVKKFEKKKGFMPVLKKMVSPTLAGLILYFQSTELENSFTESMGLDKTEVEKQKIENRKLFPFIYHWDFLIKQISNAMESDNSIEPYMKGRKKCFMAIAKTIRDFRGIHKAKFIINPQKLTFDGYLEVPSSMLLLKEPNLEVEIERDEQIANLLKNPKFASLVRAYLAYSITKDIRKMSLLESEEVSEALDELDSEKEFRFFMPDLARKYSLFKDDRLKDYVPEYASLNSFFTGLFVKNLIYIETIKEKRPSAGNNDYKIHFLEE